MLVTDAQGCTISSSVNVAQPTILNSSLISSTPVSCFGGNNGSGNITANGGSGPYIFSWSPSGGNLSSASGLAAGNYNVTVTDAHNCVSTTSINIVQPPVLLSSIASFGNAMCYGDSSGYATVTQSGGTPPYSYTWTPNSDNSPSATGLRAGNYSVTITDVNGCNSASTITISEPSPIAMNLVSSVDVSCFGGSDGSAVLTTTGGTSAYTYQWPSSSVTGPSENNLSSGNYNVEVTDVNNCKDTISIAINQPAVLSSSVSSTNTKCFGSMDGFAAATPSGGTGPYTFLWSPGNSSTNLYTGVSSGNYDVTITDSKGCTYTSSAIINQPTDLNLSVTTINSTCGNSNGKVIVDVTGGTTRTP